MTVNPTNHNAIGFAIAYAFVVSRFRNTNEVQYAVQPVYLQSAFPDYTCVDLSARWNHLVIPNNRHSRALGESRGRRWRFSVDVHCLNTAMAYDCNSHFWVYRS